MISFFKYHLNSGIVDHLSQKEINELEQEEEHYTPKNELYDLNESVESKIDSKKHQEHI